MKLKKALKITGITLGLLVVLLLLAPFIFKGSIEKLLLKNINQNLNATVAWESLDLSLIRSFPNASVRLSEFTVINNAPFEGDTLATGEALFIDMGITQLFKGQNEPIKVNALSLDNAQVKILLDSLGIANYDIAKQSENDPNETKEDTESEEGFSFALSQYEISDSYISYTDLGAGVTFIMEDFNHKGTGDLSAALSTLKTESDLLISLKIGEVAYFTKNPLTLDANFELDLELNKYSFLENTATLNALPITFEGWIQNVPDSTKIDLTFKTLSSDFKNFLAVMPKEYVKELDDVKTTGQFIVDGTIKGVSSESTIPLLDVAIKSENASFKYPSLPKAVNNITIDAAVKNTTGKPDDTYVQIGTLAFKIDNRPFSVSGNFKNLTKNILVNMALQGSLDLSNIEQVLPIELEQQLSGIFTADMTTAFDMNSIDKQLYDNIKSQGTASLEKFTYQDEYFNDALAIQNASVRFSPNNIKLDALQASTGQTDVNAKGTIENLIPWIMGKQDLRGRFSLQSQVFNMNDFMSTAPVTNAETTAGGKTTQTSLDESIKIPDFLDAVLDFRAGTVIYDDLELKDASGTISIQDETAQLSNVKTSALGGNIAMNGNVSTAQEMTTFSVNLDMQKIDMARSFDKLSLIKYLAPIANALDGDLNTSINLTGNLSDKMTPVLESLTGSALAQILTAEVSSDRTPLLAKLSNELSFLNVDELSLRNISTAFDFEDGQIKVKPFDFMIEDIKVGVAGTHKLDKTMDYQLALDVPAKYLGSDVTKLLAKLKPSEAEAMTVSLPVGIGGSITNPTVNVNSAAAINELTQRLINEQKDEIVEQGTGILDRVLGNSSKETDSTKTDGGNTTKDEVKDVVKDVLGGILGGRKKKKDSIPNNQ